jgi:16S rRNA (cytidine1402-2'-O)-methyltransferase
MEATARGVLHLVAVPIAPGEAQPARAAWDERAVREALPEPAIQRVRSLRYFLVENARTARAFLKAAGHPASLSELRIAEVGHEPQAALLDEWLAPLLEDGQRAAVDAALLSEAGCPGIADPGAQIVARAHELGIRVQPWVGPSSILLALMGAGMNGQRFRFLGYLPQEREALRARLASLQQDARRGETQIFIETPYRNERLLEELLVCCDPVLRLCLAVDLMGAQASLQTRSIAQWRALAPAARPALHRRPAVFLVHGAGGGPLPRPRAARGRR